MEPYGVVRICPTLTTEHFDVLAHAARTIATLCERSPSAGRRIAGLHVEGPYITAEDGARGAHPRQHCRPPDWEEFQRLQELAQGRIRILTLSPEYEEAERFIRRVVRSGVLVAIGHTSATPDQIGAAVDAGARLSTHLGNGSHPTLPRLRNYLWQQLAEDRLAASLIVDGHHLPWDVVKTFLRAKTPQRCVLISDLSGQAGQAPGRYVSPFCEVEILTSGRLVVAGQREIMAGASLPLSVGVGNITRFVDLACAIRMAAQQPAELIQTEAGSLEPGGVADLVQFDLNGAAEGGDAPTLAVRATMIDGQIAWGEPWQPAHAGEIAASLAHFLSG